jgi:hypothetical protein
VTTGPPLYVVSACGTAEEFVAAFRRYADRTGLFVPLASPLPAGKRGRLALTLKDGGVMIEGEAEILQSSARPTVLHGRPGMTVKFVEPDAPSKIVIGELEKARLAMKPAPPSVPPRPANVPAEPRPVPPTPTGRIDAANSLAECVVIGDISKLQDTAAAHKGNVTNDSSSSRFVVPAIPAVGGRAKTPSSGGAPSTPASKAASAPTAAGSADATNKSRMTTIGFPALDKLPAKSDSSRVVGNATTLGMPALGRKADPPLAGTKTRTERPVGPPASALAPDEATTLGTAPPKKSTDPTIQSPPIDPSFADDEATALGASPKRQTDPMPATSPPARPPKPESAAPASFASRGDSSQNPKATSIGFPAVRGPAFETQARGIAVVAPPSAPQPSPPKLPKSAPGRGAPAPRGKTPTTPPLTPRHPTPVAPVPIVRWPARNAPAVSDEEPTDLGAEVPQVVAAPAAAEDSGRLLPVPVQRSGGMRASEILAAIPAGDWTMTPDESIPHPLPPEAKAPVAAVVSEPTPAPAAPPEPVTGNWTISLDPQTQSWSEPEKLAKPPAAPTSGNPIASVASDKPISVVQRGEKPTGAGESKIEIDSALIEAAQAAQAAQAAPNADGTGPQAPLPTTRSALALDATAPQTAIADTIPPPLPSQPTSPPAPSPAPGFAAPRQLPYPSVDLRDYPARSMPAAPAGKRKKMIAMAIGAVAVAVGAIVVLVMTLSGQDKPGTAATTSRDGATIAVPTTPSGDPAGTQQATVPHTPADSETAPSTEPGQPAEPADPNGDDPSDDEPGASDGEPASASAAAGTCSVQLASTPSGADVYIGRKKRGTTPATLDLPCGVKTRVSLRKNKYASTLKSFTPQADKPNQLTFRLKREVFLVKVTSTPPGATITAGGRSLGVTPTTIKLPANDASTITLTKPGYSAVKTSVTPKKNNTSHHVALKKGR